MMILACLVNVGLAQETETLNALAARADGFSAQSYRPPIDSRTSLWTERTTTYSELAVTAQILGTYTRNPLVLRLLDDSETVLLGDLYGTELGAAVHSGRFRLGVLAPIYLAADGASVAANGAGLGDLAFDLKLNLLRDEKAPFGLAVSGRIIAPTATIEGPLGTNELGWEAMVLADKQLGHVLLAANVGMRGAPAVELNNIALDDQLFYRGALSYLFATNGYSGLSVDVAGQLNLEDVNAAGVPFEAMVGGWGRLARSLTLRGGVGHGFTDGIGSPDLRVLVGLALDPDLDRDTDGDGIVDRKDACPEEAEDKDGRRDEDGCPDLDTNLLVSVQAPDGRPVAGVQSALLVGDTPTAGDAELAAVVEPGTYSFTASAPGYAPLQATLEVPAVRDHHVVQVMRPLPVKVYIRLTDLEGRPIDGEWSLDGQKWTPERDGSEVIELLPGGYMMYGRAEGFHPAESPFTVEITGDNEVLVSLGERTSLVAERIELHEVVQFRTASAEILSGSFPMLDEVVKTLKSHPEIASIKIEGHTDSRGSDEYNLDLSTRRAAAIMSYLTRNGVAPERLVSEGFGERRPIASNDTPEGMFRNRRVEIRVLERVERPPSE